MPGRLAEWVHMGLVSGLIVFLLAGLSFLLPAPGEGKTPDRLVILSPHWEGVKREFTAAFRSWYRARCGRDVVVEWLDQGGTSDDLRFVKSEFMRSPAGIDIDIFFGGGIDPYVELSRSGLLERFRLRPETLDRVGREISGVPVYDGDYRWYGAALSGFGIVYNKVVLRMVDLPEVKTWADLADPRVRTWVGSGDPRSSGAMHMMYEIILQAYGWKKGWSTITRMGGNIRSFVKSGSQVAKDVAVGEVAYGLCIDQYAWAQIAEVGADRIGFVLPEGLTVVNPDAIAILKGAPHRETAKSFVEFVMSEEGQRLWMVPRGKRGGPKEFDIFRLSVVPGLYSELAGSGGVRLNPFKWHGAFRYDSETGSLRWSILNDLIGAMIIDNHEDLERAWKKTVERGMRKEDLARLEAVPVTESDLDKMAARWGDPTFRNETMAAWAAFAREKYRRVLKGGSR